MTQIFIVTMETAKREPQFQFAFYDYKEAKKFLEHLDKTKDVAGFYSFIKTINIYEDASELIELPPVLEIKTDPAP
jgi:hypothetical protein